MGTLNAPVQGASFYVEKIKLDSKLRELYQKWRWSRTFSDRKSPHIFSDTILSNFIICKFKNLKQLFSLQNSKTTYYKPFQPISTIFHFLFFPFLSTGLKCFHVYSTRQYTKSVFLDRSFLEWGPKMKIYFSQGPQFISSSSLCCVFIQIFINKY